MVSVRSKNNTVNHVNRSVIKGVRLVSLMVLITIVMAALISCAPSSSGTSSESISTLTQTTSVPSPQSSTPNSQGRSRPGANGTVSQISGSTITLNNQNGQVTVDILPNAMIEKTISSSMVDLQTGQTVTVIGSSDPNGNVTASRISIRSQNASFPSFTPRTGASPSTSPSRPTGNTPGGFNRSGNTTFGTIVTVNGNSIAITTAQSQQTTVTISSDTTIEKTVSGILSDVQIGDFISAMGTADQNGNIQATFVTIGSGSQAAIP